MNHIDAILFDLDGTLWDSSESVAKSWNLALSELNIQKTLTKEDIQSVMGMIMTDIADKLFPEIDKKTRYEVLKKCCEIENAYIENNGGILFENLEKTLTVLSKDYKLAIVSNCQAGYIEAFLKSHKLSKYFCDFENPGRTGLVKGENIKLVVNRNNFKNIVYVGDTLSDYKATQLAKVKFIYARYGFGEVKDYKYAIDKIEDLPNYIKEIEFRSDENE